MTNKAESAAPQTHPEKTALLVIRAMIENDEISFAQVRKMCDRLNISSAAAQALLQKLHHEATHHDPDSYLQDEWGFELEDEPTEAMQGQPPFGDDGWSNR